MYTRMDGYDLALLPEMILEIAKNLDAMSLYYLSLTSKHIFEITNIVWGEQINKQFPLKKITLNFPSYFHFFSKQMNHRYNQLKPRQKKLFNLIQSNDLSLIQQSEIIFCLKDFEIKDRNGTHLGKILRQHQNDELCQYIFNQVCKVSDSSDDATKCELICLGVELNLSTGLFQSMCMNMKNHIDLFESNSYFSPLAIAASMNSLQAATMLLKLDINIKGVEELSPLQVASCKGYLEMVKLLISYGADVNEHFKEGSPLYIASREGHLNVVDYLLLKGAKVNTDYEGSTALYVASEHGRHLCVERLLKEKEIDIYAERDEGSTALYIAAKNGHAKVCELLLDAGANVECFYAGGYTPLYVSVDEGKAEVVSVLLRYFPNVNHITPSDSTALYAASYYGFSQIVQMLCEKGADPNLGSLDISPLYIAALKNHLEVVKILALYGAQINHQDDEKMSPLFVAIQRSHETIVKFLLTQGADTTLSLQDGVSPLHVACKKGNKNIIKLLLRYGADPLAKNDKNETPAQVIPNDEPELQTIMNAIEKISACMLSIPFYSESKLIIEPIIENIIHRHFKWFTELTTSKLSYTAFLFAFLQTQDKKNKLATDIAQALGYQSIEVAKLALHNVIMDYFGHQYALFECFESNVIKPIVQQLKLNDTMIDPHSCESAFIYLVYFEGLVEKVMPRLLSQSLSIEEKDDRYVTRFSRNY